MQDMIYAISTTLEETLLQKVCASPFYSIVLDETNDLSTVKQLGVVVHYIDMETAVPAVSYLKLLDMTKAIAAALESAVTTYLETSSSLGISKLGGASSDGASVMMGQENGLMTRLKRKVPQLIVTHCSAHWLALTASDVSKYF